LTKEKNIVIINLENIFFYSVIIVGKNIQSYVLLLINYIFYLVSVHIKPNYLCGNLLIIHMKICNGLYVSGKGFLNKRFLICGDP